MDAFAPTPDAIRRGGEQGNRTETSPMKARVGQYFLLLGFFALIFFWMSLQAEAGDWRLLLSGAVLLLVGIWLYLRNRPRGQSAERFRLLRKFGSRRKK
ncbi:MAG: hypothetical protein JW862_02330 [Anaerolineales bacterium]|nr:hypothetical protein [Anaerolineales bacterium]